MLGRSSTSLQYYPELAWVAEACRADQQRRKQQREQALVSQVEQAIQDLKRQGQTPTQRAISDLTGLSVCIFRDYPRLKVIATRLTAEQRQRQQQQAQQRDQRLLEAVEAAIVELQSEGKRPTRRALAQQVGVSLSTLSAYPQTNARLKQWCQQQVAEARQRARALEPILVEQVQTAIEQLHSAASPVTQKSICQLLGRSATHLSQYPKVREIFQQIAAERRLKQRKSSPPRDDLG